MIEASDELLYLICNFTIMMKSYLNLMILLSLLLFVSLSLSAAKRVEGYLIMPEGDTLQATFKLPLTLGDSPNYWRIQQYIKMYDEYGGNKTIKIYPKTVRELGFEYEDELVKLRSVYDEKGTLQTDTAVYHYNNLFLKVELEGPLTLYKYHYKLYVWNFTEAYVMQKENGDLFFYRKWFFRKDMSQYLAECQEVANKIEDGQYKEANLKVIVNQYNKWYRYQTR